jgi:hypothetical protein
MRSALELQIESDACIDKVFAKLDAANVELAASSVSLKPNLDIRICTCLEEAQKQILDGEEYTGFMYIKDLIYLYIQVCEYQCKEDHKDYGELVQLWNTKLHMLETLQYTVECIRVKGHSCIQ